MLELEVSPRDRDLLASHGTQMGEAYDLYLRARGYLQDYDSPENIERAIADFQRALVLDPNYVLAYAGLGSAYWRKYESSKQAEWINTGRQNCEHAVALEAKTSAGHICLGTFDNGTGRYEKAAAQFQKALDAEPTNDEAYRGLARAEERLGRMTDAEKTYRRAIALRPHYWAGYNWLGHLYSDEARYPEAIAQFQQALTLSPENGRLYYSMGGVYILMGRYQEAISALKKSIELRPAFEAYSNLGQAYFGLRRFDDAITAFEQVNRLGALHHSAVGNLARAYYFAPGKRAQAREIYQRAIRMAEEQLKVNANDSDTHIMLADYNAMLGKRSQAFLHLQRALGLRPNDPEILFFAAVVHNQFGEREQALNWLQKSAARGYSRAQIEAAVELDNLRNEARFKSAIQPR